jgi:carbonic anhydrase/acetyltransferase-like protein (isoleucine patch superfamily)
LIGMGAILLDRSRVGTGSLVGAGSVVKERFEVPDGTLAVGNPAINKKKLEGNAADWVARGADDYLRLIKRYADNSRVL